MEPPAVVRCSYVVPKKGRRCRFPVIPGTARCGAHREDDRGRIPCPLDPKHTVFEDRLEQHLKICSKLRDQSVIEKQPFYEAGVNQGPPTVAKVDPVSSASEDVVEDWMRRISIAWPEAAP